MKIQNVKRNSNEHKKNMKLIDIVNVLRKEFKIAGNVCEVIQISCSKLKIHQENECLMDLAKKCIIAI